MLTSKRALMGCSRVLSTTAALVSDATTTTIRPFSTVGLRRQRRYERQEVAKPRRSENFGKLEQPYEHGEDSLDSYLEKTSLSPWVPLPDVVARKALDLCQVGPEDHHVDLGSGDGRVCFHALQQGVASSVGIDVDEGIVQVALERMAKRHPQPPNLHFFVADLLEEDNPVWEHVLNANVITMYFATEALERFRPLLEQKLAGRTCKIVTCGYEMPGWEATVQEVVLGTQVHLYLWGHEDEEEDEDDFFFAGPDILEEKPKEMLKNHLEGEKFAGANIIDKTGRHPIRGFNPDTFNEDYDDDEDWEIESDTDDEEEESKEAENSSEAVMVDKWKEEK